MVKELVFCLFGCLAVWWAFLQFQLGTPSPTQFSPLCPTPIGFEERPASNLLLSGVQKNEPKMTKNKKYQRSETGCPPPPGGSSGNLPVQHPNAPNTHRTLFRHQRGSPFRTRASAAGRPRRWPAGWSGTGRSSSPAPGRAAPPLRPRADLLGPDSIHALSFLQILCREYLIFNNKFFSMI